MKRKLWLFVLAMICTQAFAQKTASQKSLLSERTPMQEGILLLDESQLDNDEGGNSQSPSLLSGSGDDVYLNAAGFSFSPMRFRIRGYNQEYESTYINGVGFNDLERGRFNYSMLGGMNDAMRNKHQIPGLGFSSFSFGNVGGATNIDTRASSYAAGHKASIAYTNRAYKLRGQYTYSTGLMPNGWAITASAVIRWADEGIVEGTFYQSAGYFLAVEKKWKDHSFSLTTFGAPTQRGQAGATVQEAYDLTGSIYYNSLWGYQNGQKRNSRIVQSYDPTVILAHEWTINDKSKLKSGIGAHYSMYSNSAINFYNAPDPRPDYYRNLPSFQENILKGSTPDKWVNESAYNEIKSLWESRDPNVTQINWNSLYQANYRNNVISPEGSAKYMVERRHNNLLEGTLNSTYTNQLTKKLKLTAGVEFSLTRGMHYKTIDDLLGANQWLDIDQFAERDFAGLTSLADNDLRNPNKQVGVGSVFGYNYDMNVIQAGVFAQNEWIDIVKGLDVSYGLKLTYTQFQRYGYMENGRAPGEAIDGGSFGLGKSHSFVDPSVKLNITYRINGHHWIKASGLFETKAPLAGSAYVSPRIKDQSVPNLQSEMVYSYDLSYNVSYPFIKGRVSVFNTIINGASERAGYYDDMLRTFVNHNLYGVDKNLCGVELGVEVPIAAGFSASLAGTFASYTYLNNPRGIASPENGRNEDGTPYVEKAETVMYKGLKLSTGPQVAAHLKISYMHPKMWFADITLNYFDNNYLSVAPSRFTESAMKQYTSGKIPMRVDGKTVMGNGYVTNDEMMRVLGSQEKLPGGFILDASVGKVIYFKGRSQSLNINISGSNLTNNTSMITGGYQQGRISRDSKDKKIDNVDKYPSKYYYAWGINFFLNIGYRF